MILLKTNRMVSAPHNVALRLFHVQQGTVQGSAAELAKVAEIKRVYLAWDDAPKDYRAVYPRSYDNREAKPTKTWMSKYD